MWPGFTWNVLDVAFLSGRGGLSRWRPASGWFWRSLLDVARVHLERSRCGLSIYKYLEEGVCLDEALHLDDSGGLFKMWPGFIWNVLDVAFLSRKEGLSRWSPASALFWGPLLDVAGVHLERSGCGFSIWKRGFVWMKPCIWMILGRVF